jgi:hypothetical protein
MKASSSTHVMYVRAVLFDEPTSTEGTHVPQTGTLAPHLLQDAPRDVDIGLISQHLSKCIISGSLIRGNSCLISHDLMLGSAS